MNQYNQYNQGYGQGYGVAPGAYAGGIDFSEVMRQVYLWLAVGLLLGFGVALGFGQQLASGQTALLALMLNPFVMFGSIILYLVVGFSFFPVVRRASPTVAAVMYLAFTAIFGFMISTIFIQYTSSSIWTAFLTTTAMFGAMSLIGYTTKMDLSKLGAIFLMALIGLIIASVVNIFMQNSVLYWIVSVGGVIIFSGLTAYDTQWIKRQALSLSASSSADPDMIHRVALMGAFRLFLDFVNMFLFLLRIFGRNN